MRIAPFLTASVATIALGLPAVALAAPATAAVAPTAAIDAPAAMKVHRVINSKIVNVTPRNLQIRTKVRNYPTAWTFLQKKNCKACAWHVDARKRTNQFSRVAYPVDAPVTGRWYYRVGTPARGKFLVSFGQTFYTYQR